MEIISKDKGSRERIIRRLFIPSVPLRAVLISRAIAGPVTEYQDEHDSEYTQVTLSGKLSLRVVYF